jgi:uncharacterized surface anchored protein
MIKCDSKMNVTKHKISKFNKIIGIALVAMLAFGGLSGAVSAQEEDIGDINVTVEDNGQAVNTQNMTLMDASDDTEVEVLETDSDGIVSFSEISYGEYYLSYSDSEGVTYDSATFETQTEVSLVNWDVDANTLTLEDGSGSLIEEYVGNQDDFVVTDLTSEEYDDTSTIIGYAGVVVGTVITLILLIISLKITLRIYRF